MTQLECKNRPALDGYKFNIIVYIIINSIAIKVML